MLQHRLPRSCSCGNCRINGPLVSKKFTTKRNAQQSPRDQTDTCATDEMAVGI
jgi:hypothetical protein